MFIWFLYCSSASAHGYIAASVQTSRLNHGCIVDAHDAFTFQYSACTFKPVMPAVPTIVWVLTMVRITILGNYYA